MEPISYLQALILGALQGLSEPFPISSLGHAVLLPKLLGWDIHQNDDYFLTFLVATHCATALVLFLFFLDDWKRIWFGFVRSVKGRSTPRDLDARLAWVIIIGTIPAGILGIALEHKLRALFASPTSAAIFLTINGVLLLAVERFRRRPARPGDGEGDGDERIAKLGFRQALGIGAAQALALIPGISRSGATIVGDERQASPQIRDRRILAGAICRSDDLRLNLSNQTTPTLLSADSVPRTTPSSV